MKQALLFTGKKLLRAALLLLGVSLAAFLLLCASPLDPLQTNVGQVALVLVVVLFALLGERVRLLADPASAHETGGAQRPSPEQ